MQTRNPQTRQASNRRRHGRVRLGGSALLFVDLRQGLIGAKGHLIDLSEGGCQLGMQRRVDAKLAGRVRLKLAGKALWFPVFTRQVVKDGDGWTVRCAFGRLTTKKEDTLRTLLFKLSLNLIDGRSGVEVEDDLHDRPTTLFSGERR